VINGERYPQASMIFGPRTHGRTIQFSRIEREIVFIPAPETALASRLKQCFEDISPLRCSNPASYMLRMNFADWAW
jgi:hypothetical protein